MPQHDRSQNPPFFTRKALISLSQATPNRAQIHREVSKLGRPKRAFVDRGYRGHGVQTTAVCIAGQKRGLTPALRRDLRRRSAIEPMIGHMKTDGRLARCALKGTLGDALHAVLCGCGHNIRMILAHRRALWARTLSAF